MKSTYKSLFEIIEESVEQGRGGWDLDHAHPRLGRSFEQRLGLATKKSFSGRFPGASKATRVFQNGRGLPSVLH